MKSLICCLMFLLLVFSFKAIAQEQSNGGPVRVLRSRDIAAQMPDSASADWGKLLKPQSDLLFAQTAVITDLEKRVVALEMRIKSLEAKLKTGDQQ